MIVRIARRKVIKACVARINYIMDKRDKDAEKEKQADIDNLKNFSYKRDFLFLKKTKKKLKTRIETFDYRKAENNTLEWQRDQTATLLRMAHQSNDEVLSLNDQFFAQISMYFNDEHEISLYFNKKENNEKDSI